MGKMEFNVSKETREVIGESIKKLINHKVNKLDLSLNDIEEAVLPKEYQSFLNENYKFDDIKDSTLLAAATDCVLSIKSKQIGDFDEELIGHIISTDIISKDCFLADKEDIHDFQVLFSDVSRIFSTDALDELKNIYSDVKNNNSALARRAFSTVICAATLLDRRIHTFKDLCQKADPHLVSLGSKKTAAKSYINFEQLKNTLVKNCPDSIVVECFGRTAFETIYNRYLFTMALVGDNDEDFVNYFNTLSIYPLAVIQEVWRKLIMYGLYDADHKPVYKKTYECSEKKGNKCSHYTETDEKAIKEISCHLFNAALANKPSSDAYKKMGIKERIKATANHFFLVNLSYEGNMKKPSYSTESPIFNNINNVMQDLLFTALVMQNIDYVLADFRKTVKKVMNNPNALLIVDPPYLMLLMIGYRYKDKYFTSEDMDDLFVLLKKAQCKVVFYHSHYWKIATLCRRSGLMFVGDYGTRYKTDVFVKNISDEEQVFVKKCIRNVRKFDESYEIADPEGSDVL